MPPTVAYAGLALALLGAPALLLATRRMGLDERAVVPRLLLWALAGGTLVLAARADRAWATDVGFRAVTGRTVLDALAATAVALGGWPFVQRLQKALGGVATETTETFRRIAALPASRRLLLVVTAAVVEEILYRGIAIGVGAHLVGGVAPAFALSLAVFVVAHARWGASHLVSVLWAGGAMSLLFVLSRDLGACILAHFAIDAVGLLVVPALLARRAADGRSGD